MPALQWDTVGDRVFESGVNKGVLYLADGTAVPWNGLTSVTENFNHSTTQVYFDGSKVNDAVTVGSLSASMSAITYPEKFVQFEGFDQIGAGTFLVGKKPKTFNLSYQTNIGNDVDGADLGYKIHILYNLTATPSARSYQSNTQDPSWLEFQWELTSVPEQFPGHQPSSAIIIDSRKADPTLFAELESKLYGGVGLQAKLPSYQELMEFITSYYNIQIIDNKDGTWTAITDADIYITIVEPGEFRLDFVNAIYLNENVYRVSNT